MLDKAKKCKSKKCKAEKFTAKKAMFGIVMPRNTKLSTAKLKNAGLRMESFSCFIIHGNCILFEFLASFSRCHVVPWQHSTNATRILQSSWGSWRSFRRFRILKVPFVQLLEPSVLMSFLNPFVADCRHLHCSSRRPSPQLLEMAASLRPFASVENGSRMQKSDSQCGHAPIHVGNTRT